MTLKIIIIYSADKGTVKQAILTLLLIIIALNPLWNNYPIPRKGFKDLQ